MLTIETRSSPSDRKPLLPPAQRPRINPQAQLLHPRASPLGMRLINSRRLPSRIWWHFRSRKMHRFCFVESRRGDHQGTNVTWHRQRLTTDLVVKCQELTP
jgi:hypothetical protein